MTKPLVVLGVTGGIAAYKSAEIIRRLRDNNYDVQVIATKSALNFIGEVTLAALSGREVVSDIWNKPHEVEHVKIAKEAALVLVAPATADFLAHLVNGFADNALLATLLTAKCPKVLAPAMHTEMWENLATQENIRKLKEREFIVINPDKGALTSEDTGIGRLPDPLKLVEVVNNVIKRNEVNPIQDLKNIKVLISAGGTREAIDPIRFIGNRSSGLQGLSFARAAISRGAQVCLIGANIKSEIPAGCDYIPVEDASELREELLLRVKDFDLIIMNAAVSDYRVKNKSNEKIKKINDEITLELVKNPDILQEISRNKNNKQIVVGFAAETIDDDMQLEKSAKLKLEQKGCDVIFANKVKKDQAMESINNEFLMVSQNMTKKLMLKNKFDLANEALDYLSALLVKVGSIKKSPVEPDLV
ncbi:MAG: bifunctional phosphopantothenoylcysteine decarboxylase/phosphopantothenate--cysteine ligase CoaBC [Actinomycetota bacterium]